MKSRKMLFQKMAAGLLAAVMFLLLATPAMAQVIGGPETNTFVACSNNNATNIGIGQAQLSVHISLLTGDRILFRFENAGPNASSITDIYFHDPANDLLTFASFVDSGTGVSFAAGASPPNLPSANNCPSVGNTSVFSSNDNADSNSPTAPNGVNPGEWLEITMALTPGFTFEDIISGLSTGQLRIGIHVQAFAGGGSESFVNSPNPTYIQLAGFNVVAGDTGAIVQWETATEIDNAGFNIYRASSLSGPYVKINEQLIAAAGSAATYEYVDADGAADSYYRLEDIDTSGVATLHLPAQVEAAAPVLDNFLFVPIIAAR
jgi:hypothetical protein